MGQDVSKSRSPAIHNAAYKALGIEGRFEAISVDASGFNKMVQDLGALGYHYVNVTIPYKGAAAAAATTRSAMVRNCGAANTLIFEPPAAAFSSENPSGVGFHALHAENTDGYGLLSALRDLGADAGGQDAVLIGAGGAAAGAIEALTSVGARVRVVARRLEAATALVERIPSQRRRLVKPFAWGDGGLAQALEGSRILVSSVPADSWADAAATAGLDAVERDTAVLEMAYGTSATSPLARAVRGRVARYSDGLGMLVHQAVRAMELALGETPPLPPLFAAARNGK